MNQDLYLYIVLYNDDHSVSVNTKIAKVFTDKEKAQDFLLSKATIGGKKISRDNRWKLQVFSYISSNNRYEFSQWETVQFKNNVDICSHCGEYFKRVNNMNMCEKCFNQIQKGLIECDVCKKFFNPHGDKFTSNGDVFPSIACINCSKTLIENLKNR